MRVPVILIPIFTLDFISFIPHIKNFFPKRYKPNILCLFLFLRIFAGLSEKIRKRSIKPYNPIRMNDTIQQFETVSAICRSVFEGKFEDYGATWRLLRPESVTDQLLIKAKRIRTLETKKENKVDEGIFPELVAIVNYGIMGLIQLERGYSDRVDVGVEEALSLYDKHLQATKELMFAKNHDYDEAWRIMRTSSYTDLILVKLHRIKQIEDNLGKVSMSEGVDSNYADIVNYALFGLIKLHFGEE